MAKTNIFCQKNKQLANLPHTTCTFSLDKFHLFDKYHDEYAAFPGWA
ncbi:MAG: hypothetical protein GY702_26490 [Desulfobulbaceae bacterium]|nr:hypothetical protein [Desulfobulbaceae bacterium]